MTATSDLIARIESAFATGRISGDILYAEGATAHELGKERYDEAVRLTRRECPLSDAIQAAELYGYAAGISKANNLGYEDDCEARLAMLLNWVVLPNRDEARIRASRLMYDLGERFLARGEKNLGAMQLTNGALAIAEMNNATLSQQESAADTLRRALRMRARNSTDYAYGLTNLAVIETQLVHRLPKSEQSVAYRNVLRKLNKANKLFVKNREKVPRSLYHDAVLEALTRWLSHELDLATESAYTRSIPEAEDIDLRGLSKSEYVSAMVSNSVALGLDSLPEWVPEWETVVQDAIARIPMFWGCVERARKYLDATTASRTKADLKLYVLQQMAHQKVGFPYESMDALWSSNQMEMYLTWAVKCMSWQDRLTPSGDSQYRALLKRSGQSVRTLRATWSARDVERLLGRNPLEFRFIACELARLEEWKDSFELLEATRGLVSSKTLNDAPDAYMRVADSLSWVHLTHSPMGTYAVCLRDGSYFGRAFPSLSGSELAALFSNIAGSGLLVEQNVQGSTAAANAAEKIALALAPVGDWICEVSGADVVVMPGGFYQTFPVWSTGMLGNDVAKGKRRVSSSPSRNIAYKNSEARAGRAKPSSVIAIEEASSVPGFAELPWSQHEPTALASICGDFIRVTANSATFDSLASSLSNCLATHFTGHSYADPDPYFSSIGTYGERVTVRHLLELDICSSLVVLGSCQSGLALNFKQQDEYLSIQSAIFYAGARYCIGTSWPVRDYVAFAFSIQFYSAMKALQEPVGDADFSPTRESFAQVVKWMRNATLAEVNIILAEYEVPQLKGNSETLAFRYYDWAAFGVVGTQL
ncbi:CHAT domain-containing protein [Gordonia sp. ABKF26]|uniref:CHAT domain-containing protein n=1 Tax=Gordonia sp. ABKF26 TaxID=3238687 RepID=UPI0034E5344E